MTSTRPYRDALPVAAALAELERASGTQFDPVVVAVLVSHARRGAARNPVTSSATRARPRT